MSRARPKIPGPLAMLLVAYLLLASLYSIITPLFEASDEVWHYPMVKYLADHGLSLPVQRPGEVTAWRQEGSQPPLYYMMGALLTFWVDSSNLDAVRRINPHADIGVIVPDGNVNMTIHDPAARGFPWHGAALAVHLCRFLSVALGALTVLMTYRLADELFPLSPSDAAKFNPLALTAAVFTAFNPMFLFISGSVNNDNLANMLAAALLVQIVRLLKRPHEAGPPTIRELILIGGLAGAGMLAKFNIGFLLPIIALALAALAYRLRDPGLFVRGALITGGLTILIAGWWYVRNWQLYGDPTGLNVFIQIVGPRAIPANAAQLWAERDTFLMSYWGFFGGVNVPLPDVVYAIFNGIALLAAFGLIVGLRGVSLTRQWAVQAGRIVTILWIAVLFGGLLRWTSETWASQGRLMFAAIAPISMWMAVGLFNLGRLFRPVRWRLAGLAGWWFAALAVCSLLVIQRAYLPSAYQPVEFSSPPRMEAASTVEIYEPGATRPVLQADLGSLSVQSVRVGDYYEFCGYFYLPVESAGRFSRNWSAFVHLVNDSGVIVAQRDVYLGQGLWATTLLDQQIAPGKFWCNRFAVRVPDYAYAPQQVRVYVGFYDVKTGERARIQGSDEHVENNLILMRQARIVPRTIPAGEAQRPNPMQVNLGDEADLIGYALQPDTLLTHPGNSVKVTLYWRARRKMDTDYRVFVQVVEPNTTNVFGQSDAMPAAWSRPTSTWQPGEVIEDAHTLTVNAAAPPGTWELVVGMYQLVEDPAGPQYRRLRIITPDGGQSEDFVRLTRVKIDLK